MTDTLKLRLSYAFKSAKTWFDLNNEAMNKSKTELIYFSLFYSRRTLIITVSVKLLGITLDDQLS